MAALNGYTNVGTINDADETILWQAGAAVNALASTWAGYVEGWVGAQTGLWTLSRNVRAAPASGVAAFEIASITGQNCLLRMLENNILRGGVAWASAAGNINLFCTDTGGANFQYPFVGVWNDYAELRHANVRKARTMTTGLDVDGTVIQRVQFVTGTGGGSTTVDNDARILSLIQSSTLATYTITMPAAPVDEQVVRIATRGAITTLTHSPNAGQSLNGALSTMAADSFAEYVYRSASTAWFRVG